jgi:hypothetical protein
VETWRKKLWRKKKMKKKIMAIEAAALILGTMILSVASAQTVQNSNTVHEENLMKELKEHDTCFGSIYGSTVIVRGPMVVDPVLCIVTVYSEEAKIIKSCISFGSYEIKKLPLGCTYAVTAGSLSEEVTLTVDNPSVMVNFDFGGEKIKLKSLNYQRSFRPIIRIQCILEKLLSKPLFFFY